MNNSDFNDLESNVKTRVFLGAIFLMSSPVAIQALPAFYGAEGAGATSVGGRGGVVCQVTNLNDSGPGSLRACVQMSGPRTVVFRVVGTIKLNSTLWIENPNITIAGQTAPGGGIMLTGENLPDEAAMIRIVASDVIVRFIRLRAGPRPVGRGYPLVIRSGSTNKSNIIVDHSSISWGSDGLVVLSGEETKTLTNVTLSWNLIAEPVDNIAGESKGTLLAWQDEMSQNTRQIDLHHNLLMNTSSRKSLNSTAESTYINNVNYNWRGGWGYSYALRGATTADIISNIFKRGPGPAGGPASEGSGVTHYPDTNEGFCGGTYCIDGPPSIYIAGNRFGGQAGLVADDWPYVQGGPSASWRRNNPLSSINPRAYPVTVHHVINDNLEQMVLSDVGASKRLDCMGNWVPNRDSVDTRLISQYINNTGVIPSSNFNDVGGFPTIAGGTPCQDSDGDGMPDAWEDANGLNKNDPSDRNTLHSSGYTMLEMYLNGPMTTNTTITTPTNVRFVQ